MAPANADNTEVLSLDYELFAGDAGGGGGAFVLLTTVPPAHSTMPIIQQAPEVYFEYKGI